MESVNKHKGFLWLAAALLLVLALTLVPILMLAQYTTPAADDLPNSVGTYRAWTETGRLGPVLRAGAERTAEIYRSWQGAYSAVFLMSLQPGIFGIRYYPVTVYLLVGSLLLSTLFFVWMLGKHVLRCSRACRLILFATLSLACLNFPPYADEAFFWYNGGMYYTFFYALSLFLYGLVIAYCCRQPGRKRNALFVVLMLLLCAVIGGGNYTTALISVVLLLAAAILARLLKKDRSPVLWLCFALLTACLLVSVLAPGNFLRADISRGILGAPRAIVKAIMYAGLYAIKWTTLPVLVLALLVIPVAWETAKGVNFSFRLPWLPPLLSLLLLGAGYTPTCYAIDYVGPDRLLDMQFYLYMLLLYANIFYATGWLNKRVLCDVDFSRVRLKKGLWLAAPLVTAALFVAVCIPESQGCLATRSAIILADGSAATYHEEMCARYALCMDPAVSDVVVPPLSDRTEPLFLSFEITSHPNDTLNVWMAEYFGKNSVALDDGRLGPE